MKETLCCNALIFPLGWSRSKKDREDEDSYMNIPYIRGVLEALTRILSDDYVPNYMKPFRRIISHPLW